LTEFSERLFQFINSHDVSKLVIDMRWNNGGNTGLIPPLLNRVIRSDKVDERGRLFVIIGDLRFLTVRRIRAAVGIGLIFSCVGGPHGSSDPSDRAHRDTPRRGSHVSCAVAAVSENVHCCERIASTGSVIIVVA
jgi:hypothetical protein